MRIKLYNTWEKVKDTFVKPSLKVYFGKWKNDPNLPVWRSGPTVYLCPKKWLSKYCHPLKEGVFIVSGTKTVPWGKDKSYECKVHEFARHTLPKGLTVGDYMWNSSVRRKLRKWHLGWVKPVIKLPYWTRFKIINLDVCWKTKFDEIRYEFPPQLSFVGFGLSLTFTLHSPITCTYCYDDSYWESILIHLYMNKSGELKNTIEEVGIWHRLEENVYYFATRPTYIVPDKQDEYYAAISEIKAKNTDKTVL